MDEKGFRLSCGCKKKRLVQRFRRREAGSKEPRKRESLTVVECMNPDGKYVTPLVIYQSKAGPLCGWFREERPEDYWYTTAEKGFSNTAISVRWMQQVFEPETRPADPNEWRILIFDGFDAHLDPKVVDYAKDHKISCFSLPSHCTHEGQPLDKALFGPMEHAYSELVSKQHVQVDKEKFQELYIKARQQVCTVDNAKAGFRATGIHPFNPLKVLEKCRLEDPHLTKSCDDPAPSTNQATSQQLLDDCGSGFSPAQPPPDGVELELYRKKALENVQQLMKAPPKPRGSAEAGAQSILNPMPTRTTIAVPIPRLLRTAHHINTITAAAQKATADLEMSKAGKAKLRDELCQRSEKQKADTRKIPNADDDGSGGTDGGWKPRLAEELTRGNQLVERKRKRDEEEADGTWKKKKASQARTKRASKKTGKEKPPACAQPQLAQLYYPTFPGAQYPPIYYPPGAQLEVPPQACLPPGPAPPQQLAPPPSQQPLVVLPSGQQPMSPPSQPPSQPPPQPLLAPSQPQFTAPSQPPFQPPSQPQFAAPSQPPFQPPFQPPSQPRLTPSQPQFAAPSQPPSQPPLAPRPMQRLAARPLQPLAPGPQ
jgi:hypothetical protein